MITKRLARAAGILLLVSVFTNSFSSAIRAETYWQAQAAYVEALEKGDEGEIIDSVRRIEATIPNPTTLDEALRIMFPSKKIAGIYESRGQYDLAAQYYARFLELTAIPTAEGVDYSEYIKGVTPLYRHNAFKPTVYAETADVRNIPYYSARAEQRAGVYHGMCDVYDEEISNSCLLYATFFDEDIGDFYWQLPKNTEDFLLVVGWNVPHEDLEDLERIVSGEADEYMRRNLEFLSSLNCRVLIRFGAEVNCWQSLPDSPEAYDKEAENFIETFKAAFRRVADAAHTYAPNAGMVYSPNDISQWYFEPEDFYPGDEYVDWVGMSAYMNVQPAATGELSSADEAYYCRGYYEDQIIKIQRFIDSFGDRKPIIITEGGYRYQNSAGDDTPEHAAAMMEYFYTYVARVYPQIKCVMYFNTNFGANKYCLFGKDGNEELAELYKRLLKNDVAMEYSMGRGERCGYAELTRIDEVMDTLDLSAFAAYPSDEPIQVEYRLDGAVTLTTSQYPYECSYSVADMGVGAHRLFVKISCKNTVTRLYYNLNVAGNGRITVSEAPPIEFSDVQRDFWGYESIAFGVENGMFKGVSETEFSPNSELTRAMFVTILGRLYGIDTEKYDVDSFDDSPAGQWFSPYVAWAKENGIVNGKTENEFDPSSPITREQMCAIIVRYAQYTGETMRIGSEDIFADDGDISSYARESVYMAMNAGLVNGKDSGKFEPASSATRAETAAVMSRYCRRFP